MERINSNIVIDSNNCWIWQKSCAGSGYGQITVNGKYWQTHRYVYTQHYGEIPEGLVIRHSCHNPKCCNPDHLSVGTHQDNYHDSIEAHTISSSKKAKNWSIAGIQYQTLKEARKATGITEGAIIKHSVNGIFNIESYRAACLIARRKPKV